MYEPRVYRKRMINDRFVTFRVIVRESDLMIGMSKKDYNDEIPALIEKRLLKLRRTLEDYILKNPEFTKKMIPIPVYQDDPEIVKRMKEAAEITNTGPMASVAGMISQEIGDYIIKKNNPKEIYIENGGDIFLKIKEDIIVSIDSGENKYFDNLGIRIGSDLSTAGICTSSGKFGHSWSEGKADSVTVISKSTYLADAMATSMANKVKSREDVHNVLKLAEDGKISLIVIKDDQIGIKGDVRLEMIGNETNI